MALVTDENKVSEQGKQRMHADFELKARRLDALTLVVFVGTVLSMLTRYVNAAYFGLKYPMTSFLYDPADRFNDFLKTILDIRAFNAARDGAAMAYTPLQHLILYVEIRAVGFLHIRPAILWITIGAFTGLLVWFLIRFFTQRGAGVPVNALRVFTLTALSFPVLFLLDRANTEMLVFAAVLGFVFFYYIRPNKWLWIAFLAVAIGLKIYPAVLLLIPFSDRRFRDTAYVVLGVVVATIVSIFVIGLQSRYGFSGVMQRWLTYLLNGQAGNAAIQWGGIQHGHSLWGATYLADVLVGKPFSFTVLKNAYTVFALAAGLAGATWLFFGRLQPWQKMTIVVFMGLLLPFSSHDYTLVHVYFPLALYVAARDTQVFDRTFTVLFALLLVPLDYYYFVQNPKIWPAELAATWPGTFTSISVLAYPLIMLSILGLIAVQERRSRSVASG